MVMVVLVGTSVYGTLLVVFEGRGVYHYFLVGCFLVFCFVYFWVCGVGIVLFLLVFVLF